MDESGFDPEYVQEGAQTTNAPDGTEQRLQEGLNERLDVSGLKTTGQQFPFSCRAVLPSVKSGSSSVLFKLVVLAALPITLGEDSGTVPVSDQKQQYQWWR